AQFAGDAAFLAVRVAPQRVFATEAGRQRALLERIVEGGLWRKEIAQAKPHALDEFPEEDRTSRLVDKRHHITLCWMKSTQPAVNTTHNREVGRKTFQPRRISWS